MLKMYEKLMNNQKQRTGIIISAICIFIAAIVIFIGSELENNQKIYIQNYKEEQQLLIDQVALRMNYYMNAEQTELTELIETMISEVETVGSRFWFVAQNEQLIFVKNNDTSKLFTLIPLDVFLKQYEANGMYISYQSFSARENHYTIGICTKEDYIKASGQLFRHNIYILMPVLLISAITLVLFMIAMLKINRRETMIKKISTEAIERNITIEKLNLRMKKTHLNNSGERKDKGQSDQDKVIYKKEVLISLLEKINRENIVPLTIIVIELSSKKKLLTSKDFHEIINAIPEILNKEQVLAEVLPGVFALLLFHTTLDHNDEIKKILVNQWALPLKKQGIKVRIGISFIEDFDTNVEHVFDVIYKKVLGNLHKDDRLPIRPER